MSWFFLYRKTDNVIWLAIPGEPDNPDFEASCEIWFRGKRRAAGIKWENSDWVYTESEVPEDIEIPEKYCYDPTTGEIYENPNYREEENFE